MIKCNGRTSYIMSIFQRRFPPRHRVRGRAWAWGEGSCHIVAQLSQGKTCPEARPPCTPRPPTKKYHHAATFKWLEPGDDFRHHVGVVRPLQVGDAVSYCQFETTDEATWFTPCGRLDWNLGYRWVAPTDFHLGSN